jgi:hypothetical protein
MYKSSRARQEYFAGVVECCFFYGLKKNSCSTYEKILPRKERGSLASLAFACAPFGC